MHSHGYVLIYEVVYECMCVCMYEIHFCAFTCWRSLFTYALILSYSYLRVTGYEPRVLVPFRIIPSPTIALLALGALSIMVIFAITTVNKLL
jgi:hypothetical protein